MSAYASARTYSIRQGLLVYGSALRLCERLERLRIRSLLDQGATRPELGLARVPKRMRDHGLCGVPTPFQDRRLLRRGRP